MPEKLAFDEGLRQSRTVDYNVRTVRVTRIVMDCMGNALLADAAFTQDQNCCICAADLFDHPINVLHYF